MQEIDGSPGETDGNDGEPGSAVLVGLAASGAPPGCFSRRQKQRAQGGVILKALEPIFGELEKLQLSMADGQAKEIQKFQEERSQEQPLGPSPRRPDNEDRITAHLERARPRDGTSGNDYG